ncbi:PilZ domain-containing protein [Methylobacterium durans]|uniref:PilZ domain-containing protein n=1 Tax=Methylobacterium durans TaxID=2202825 RepID=UPI002AFE5606|nr:PilZ domain-containing protein [Methylobacterium durans]MEA1830654.1 PilZ domain-containing protein [Methylobacterium durans]
MLSMTLSGNRIRRKGRILVEDSEDVLVSIVALSDVGARFSLSDAMQVPNTFTLVIEPQQIRMTGQVLWRSGGEVGVRFD